MSKSLWVEIKEKASIAEYLANKGCSVRFKGKTAHTRCPFPNHDDSTASFVIYDDSKYYCFGCAAQPHTKVQAQGDIFDLVAALDSLSKVEVLQSLAALTGVELVGDDYEQLRARFEESDQNKKQCNTHQVNLTNSPAWEHYLRVRRGIDDHTSLYFGLGVGNGRIAIPLRDDQGRLAGFTYHHPDAESKYINPENGTIYKKDRFLFNADSLKHALNYDNTVYITEGYFDVMSMYQAGYKATVGLCGARLREGQIQVLQKYITPETKFVFIPDGDAAGWGTLQENFDLLRRATKNSCYVITLPQEEGVTLKDPNDWFRQNKGPLPTPVPYFETIVQYHISKSPEDQDLQARRINKALLQANQLERQRVVDTLATTWNFPKDAVARFINADPTKYGDELYKDSEFRINEFIEYIKNLDKVRMSTGFKEIDDKIRGINPGEVLGIMGRANVGKTLTITELYNNLVLAKKDTPTVIFSLEMSSTQLQERIIIQALKLQDIDGISAGKILEANIKAEDPHTMEMLEILKPAHRNLVVVDTPGLSVEDMDRILNEIEATKFHEPVQRVIVDHLTIIKSPGKSDYERTSGAIKDFRGMIRRRQKCCGIILIQTSRKGGTGGDPLSMDDARNSGEIEETLDFLVGCWRPELKALAEVEKIRATPVQPVAKLLKDSDGKILKDAEGRRMYESDEQAQKRARQEANRMLHLAAKAADEHRGLMFMALLKSRREGRNTVWIYKVVGLNLVFQKEAGASFDQYVGGDEPEDPLDGQTVSPEDIILEGADLPGRALLGQPRK